jgi:phosphatidylglycerol:prolipoprotein diacylglycerol transferase
VIPFAFAAVLLEVRYPRINPVAINIPGPVDVRWYGLSYLAGAVVAYFVLTRLARNGFLRMPAEAVADLLFALMMGVIVGGRLGYVLFYKLSDYVAHPAQLIRIWEGGLSFHGGLLGVLVAAWWFARKHKVTFLNLGDSLALAVPFGIFFVRVANFVNGELFGRVASSGVPWAMRFPTDPVAAALLGDRPGLSLPQREELIGDAYRSGKWDSIKEQVPLRHPSQLYEGLLEGLAIAAILWALYHWARWRGKPLPQGTYGGLFLLCYGIFRSFVELFRQPDAQFVSHGNPLGTVLGPLTMGQTLSMGMIVAGIALVVTGARRARRGAEAPAG